MANDVNQCSFTGRLGNDVELRYTTGGKATTSFSIAVAYSRKVEDEWKTVTTWVRCKAWGREAEQIAENSAKGDKLAVWCRLTIEEWDDKKDGHKRKEAVFVIDRFAVEKKGTIARSDGKRQAEPEAQTSLPGHGTDDDIPF